MGAIGYGGMSAQKAVNRIRDELRTIDRAKKTDTVPFEVRPEKKLKPIHGILVEGIDSVLINGCATGGSACSLLLSQRSV